MKSVHLGGRAIGDGEPVFVIGEVGSNFDGDYERALELIDVAADADADAAKFQYFKAEDLYPSNCGVIPGLGEGGDFYAALRKSELPADWIGPLKKHCEKRGLIFLCSAFGEEGADLLMRHDVAGFKIASPELNHIPLLRRVASFGRPSILSTGLCTMEDIEEAHRIFADSGCEHAFLHCVSAYPTRVEECNLGAIGTIRERTGVPTGFSDHTTDFKTIPALAVSAGASLIEKHYTHDKKAKGLDHSFALDPGELKRMVKAIREVQAIRPEERARWAKKRFGERRVEASMGSGAKEIQPGERTLYPCDKRSLVAVRPIRAGEAFTRDNVRVLRSERNLPQGMHPRYFDRVIGKRAARDVPYGHGITSEHVQEWSLAVSS